MSRIAFGILGFLAVAVVVTAPQFSQSAPSAPSNTETARFDAYQRPNGNAYFALALTPQAALPSAPACELVVLFDTSASQLGKYREKGLEVLRGLLATLGDHDRVKLMAVDVNAIPLTNTFVDPRGSEMQAALEMLNRRVPLGATDLEAALTSAADSYQDRPLVQRAAVYIGDGQSNANFAGIDVAGLIDRLLKCRLSVHSFAVGPAPNVSNLAALANQTGGVVALNGDRVLGPEIGAQLAHATHGPVVWPIERKLPTSLAEIVPVKTPPLRADRESILLGKGSVAEDFPVEIKGEVASQPIDLNWTVAPTKPNDDNAFLAQLVDSAQHDGGYGLPTLGSAGLREMGLLSSHSAQGMAQLGRQAAASGDVKKALQFVNEAVREDPNNASALVLKRALGNGKLQLTSAEKPLAGDARAAPDAETGEPKPGDLLNSVEQMQHVIQQQVTTEATVQMNHARDRLTTSPGAVIDDLKRLLDRVLRVSELTSEQRSDLRSRIAALLEQATQRQAENEAADAERLQNLAASRDRQRTLDHLQQQETQLDGLIDRFNALVDQGYENADQVMNDNLRAARRDAADEFRRAATNPYGREPAAAVTAPQFASLAVNQTEAMAMREAAERGFIDEMHLVDVSHIPFPDSPPIVYPDAAFWRKITTDRKKWSGVDLAGTNPNEQKILDALNDKTSLDQSDQPLSEAMQYLSDKHHIPIQFDAPALKEASVDPTTVPVGTAVKDISLRSALKLILAQYNLTYVIKNEVLQITTNDKANAAMVTKVYPVADLVIPVQSIQIDSSMLGGGMGSMMGGGMGMGGGMMGGGMGGGMMGGGMMGGGMMGGGMFGGGGF